MCRPFARRRHKQFILNQHSRAIHEIVSVAYLDGQFYAICRQRTGEVFVYGSDFQLMDTISVKGLLSPTDIVACRDTGRIFVASCSEYENEADHCGVYCLLPGDQTTKRLGLGEGADKKAIKPWKLSITSRRLLVISGNEKLLLYGPDLEAIKEIIPQRDMQPEHAVETARETCIVSGCVFGGTEYALGEIDMSGALLRSYNDDTITLGYPRYLALDSAGRIFVADYKNSFVLLLRANLELDRVLLESDVVDKPKRVCYVEQSGLLVTIDSNSNSLCGFHVRKM